MLFFDLNKVKFFNNAILQLDDNIKLQKEDIIEFEKDMMILFEPFSGLEFLTNSKFEKRGVFQEREKIQGKISPNLILNQPEIMSIK